MSKLIKSIPLTRLRKLELPHFAKQVLDIVSKHDAEELKFKEAFEMLEGLKPLMANLEDRYGPHPLTKKMDARHKERIKYAVLIIDQMKVYIKADKGDMRSSLEIIEPEVARALEGLQKNGHVQISAKISQFFDRIEQDEQLELAFSELGLTDYLDEMQSANATYIELEKARIASIGARPKISIPPIVKELNAALRNLFNQIELAQARNSELNYMPLINELNVSIAYFVGKINQRAAINKRRAENGDSDEGVVETTMNLVPGSEGGLSSARFSAQSTIGMPPTQVNVEIVGSENGANGDSLVKEKATATSSKPLQLPSVENEV